MSMLSNQGFFMNYVVESVNFFTKQLVFDLGREEVEKIDLESQINSSLEAKRRSVTLKGFRKGKAPLDMIKKIYGWEMEKNLFQDFLYREIQNAVSKEALEVLSVLPVEDLQYKKGESLSFKVSLEIVPTIELKDFSGHVFTQGDPRLTEQEFDNFLKDYWRMCSSEVREMTDEGAVLGEGKFGTFDVKGSREDGTVEVEDKEYFFDWDRKQEDFAGFREKVLGMKKGEKRSFELVMSDDYSNEQLRGVKLLFDVNLLEIKEVVVSEPDDEFAKERGFQGIEDMKENLKKSMTDRKQREVNEKLRRDIEEHLLDENPFDIPGSLLGQREDEAKESIKKNFSKSGHSNKDIGAYLEMNKKEIREQVVRSTRLSLIFRSLIRKYGIEISEGESNRNVEDKVFEKILENVTVQHQQVEA